MTPHFIRLLSGGRGTATEDGPTPRRVAANASGAAARRRRAVSRSVRGLERRDVRRAHPLPVLLFVRHDSGVDELLLALRPRRILLHAPHPDAGYHPGHTPVLRDADDRLLQVVPFEILRAPEILRELLVCLGPAAPVYLPPTGGD